MINKIKSFTLVELLIATSIFLVVMVTLYGAFQAGMFGFRNIEENIAVHQAARRVLERISLDLRNHFAYSRSDTRFFGQADEIRFLTRIPQYALVDYKFENNRVLRLCRANKESLNDNSEVSFRQIAKNIAELRFAFGYIGPDGQNLEWKDSWAAPESIGEQKAFPAAIKVTLVFKNKIKQEFQRTIFLL